MKNFPHQINQIEKLTAALQIIYDMIKKKEDVLDDGVLGYELARKGIYKFRGNYNTVKKIEKKIKEEQKKKKVDQGARTCARDLRRFFELLQFIKIENNVVSMTDAGILALQTMGDKDKELTKEVWKMALNNLELLDEDISHPYVIMLKLISVKPNIEKNKLALMFEAKNDSNEEFDRICRIADMQDWKKEISCSENQLANAVKILPSLAEQINDISISNNVFKSNVKIEQLLNKTVSAEVNADEIATIPVGQDIEAKDNILDMTQSILSRKERTIRHQLLVRKVAKVLEERGYKLYENPMDCYAVRDNDNDLLIEVKTLSGEERDEKSQVRLALGQLLYYEKFCVESFNKANKIEKIAVFEKEINHFHKELLEENNCRVAYNMNGKILGL